MITAAAVGVYGAALAAALCANILVSLWLTPRAWVRHLPPVLQQKVMPASPAEKALSWRIMLPFFLLVIAGPVTAVVDPAGLRAEPHSAISDFLTAYGVLFVFNLADLLVLDWLVVAGITPAFLVAPGLERSDLRFFAKHFTDFLKGCLFLSVPAAIATAIAQLF